MRSSLEVKIDDILESVGFVVKSYKDKNLCDKANTMYYQYPFGNFIFDFANPFTKFAIEIDGDYWHPNSKKINFIQFKSLFSDNAKLKLAKDWKIIRIKENEITQQLSRKVNMEILRLIEV